MPPTAASPPATPSPVLLGKYELQEEIGRGGMGIVYRGYDTQLKRPVAIKVLAPELSADPRFVQRFRKEAIAAASLDHPSIVAIYDVGQEGGVHFIVMELLAGMPLNRWVQARGPRSLAQANGIVRQVASALDYAHQRGMVHCDVKPANIMVRPGKGGHATLMDFGLVRARESDEHAEGAQSASGELNAGTPEYMAPEQALGRAVDARTDIYACGAVLYHLLTGHAPFERAVPAAVVYAQVNEPPPSPRKLRPDLPKPVAAVVLKALAKSPAERYQTAGALAADLAVAITNKTPPGLKKTPTPNAISPKGSRVVPASTTDNVAVEPVTPLRAARPFPAPIAAAILVLLIAVVAGLAWALARHANIQPLPTALVVAPSISAATVAAVTQPAITTATHAVIMPPATPTVVRPTATLAAGVTATTTPAAPRVTLTPTLTPTPLAAPRLVAPADDASVSSEAIFQWEWEGVLAPGLAFEIRLWQDGSVEHLGAYELVRPLAGGRVEQRVDVSGAPAVRRGGNGVYWWTVAVVQAEPYQPIGPEAAPRRLYYNGGG